MQTPGLGDTASAYWASGRGGKIPENGGGPLKHPIWPKTAAEEFEAPLYSSILCLPYHVA